MKKLKSSTPVNIGYKLIWVSLVVALLTSIGAGAFTYSHMMEANSIQAARQVAREALMSDIDGLAKAISKSDVDNPHHHDEIERTVAEFNAQIETDLLDSEGASTKHLAITLALMASTIFVLGAMAYLIGKLNASIMMGTAGMEIVSKRARTISKALANRASPKDILNLADQFERDVDASSAAGLVINAEMVELLRVLHEIMIERESILSNQSVQIETIDKLRRDQIDVLKNVSEAVAKALSKIDEVDANIRVQDTADLASMDDRFAAMAKGSADKDRIVALGNNQIEGMQEKLGKVFAIGDISIERAGNASERIKSLAASTSQIAQSAAIISAVVSKTDMLAINANIEAVKAGAAGRGFTVVATEIKDLATQIANELKGMNTMIANMRGNADLTVGVVDDLLEHATQLIELKHNDETLTDFEEVIAPTTGPKLGKWLGSVEAGRVVLGEAKSNLVSIEAALQSAHKSISHGFVDDQVAKVGAARK